MISLNTITWTRQSAILLTRYFFKSQPTLFLELDHLFLIQAMMWLRMPQTPFTLQQLLIERLWCQARENFFHWSVIFEGEKSVLSQTLSNWLNTSFYNIVKNWGYFFPLNFPTALLSFHSVRELEKKETVLKRAAEQIDLGQKKNTSCRISFFDLRLSVPP